MNIVASLAGAVRGFTRTPWPSKGVGSFIAPVGLAAIVRFSVEAAKDAVSKWREFFEPVALIEGTLVSKRDACKLIPIVVLRQAAVCGAAYSLSMVIASIQTPGNPWVMLFCGLSVASILLVWAEDLVHQTLLVYRPQSEGQMVALRKILELDPERLDVASSQDNCKVVENGENAVRTLVKSTYLQMAGLLAQLGIVGSALCLFVSWKTCAAVFLCLAASLVLFYKKGKIFAAGYEEHERESVMVTARFNEYWAKASAIVRNDRVADVLREHRATLTRYWDEKGPVIGRGLAHGKFAMLLPLVLCGVGVTVYYAYACSEGEVGASTAILTISLVLVLVQRFEASLSAILEPFTSGGASVRTFFRLLTFNLPRNSTAAQRRVPAGTFNGEIRFEDVSFGKVLKRVSCTFVPGVVNVVVGPSGSGKSTLLKLLERRAVPDSGRITIDGRDIRSMDYRQYYREATFVRQDPQIIEGTIEEVISFGRAATGLTPDELRQAMERAFVDFVGGEDERGLDYVVKGDGSNVSGGQFKRLALAQAFAKLSRILVLDEPFNGIDKDRATRLFDGLKALSRCGVTCVVVSHEPEVMARSDRVVMLLDGTVYCEGHHTELEDLTADGSADQRYPLYMNYFLGRHSDRCLEDPEYRKNAQAAFGQRV